MRFKYFDQETNSRVLTLMTVLKEKLLIFNVGLGRLHDSIWNGDNLQNVLQWYH